MANNTTTVSDYNVLLVNRLNPEEQVYFPGEQLPVNIAAEQIGVGLGVEKPANAEEKPILFIKEAYDKDLGEPVDSAMVYVSDKDKYFKTMDVRGDVTALTGFSFAAYNAPLNTTITVPAITAGSVTVIPVINTVSKRLFSDATAGFSKYKGHLKRAVAVDGSVVIPIGTIFATAGSLSLAVVKGDTPSALAQPVVIASTGPIAAATTLTAPIMLAGTTIIEHVRPGDYFGLVLISNGTSIVASTALPSVSFRLIAIPKGTDEPVKS